MCHGLITHGLAKQCPNCPQLLNRQLQDYHIKANCDNERAAVMWKNYLKSRGLHGDHPEL